MPLSIQLERLGASAQARLLEYRNEGVARGGDPDVQCYVADVDSARGFGTLMLDRSPCLLTPRARGYYLLHRGRRMTFNELARLQGFTSFDRGPLSTASAGAMLGNAMCCSVVERLFQEVLPSMSVGVGAISQTTALPTRLSDAARGLTSHDSVALSASTASHSGDSEQDGAKCLSSFVERVLSSRPGFGHFASAFLHDQRHFTTDLCRDLLPLPCVRWEHCVGLSVPPACLCSFRCSISSSRA